MKRCLTDEQVAWVLAIRQKSDELRAQAKLVGTRKARAELRRQRDLLPSVSQQAVMLDCSEVTITRIRSGQVYKRSSKVPRGTIDAQVSQPNHQETFP